MNDFEKAVSKVLEKSKKMNVFVTIGATTEKKEGIFKVTITQFESGSSYVKRMLRRYGKGWKPKRPAYYDDYNENGSVKQLKSDPSKKYVCIWKSQIKTLREVYIDERGTILDKKDIPGLGEDEADQPRYYHIENVWYVAANGEVLKREGDFQLWKELLDNI